ncbi:hypothetical protein BDV26DRAFT_265873 [Aspergillus bertholletiae]|uniref:Secreted protein n=1 Tax=Aspergillus bertholletiae TaxID=1226010 RepID=A0A5N7B4L0_9EURO|nr:hypothetical protein BDV26DRAFT_265873 [Aspergillus bertholletiae]
MTRLPLLEVVVVFLLSCGSPFRRQDNFIDGRILWRKGRSKSQTTEYSFGHITLLGMREILLIQIEVIEKRPQKEYGCFYFFWVL